MPTCHRRSTGHSRARGRTARPCGGNTQTLMHTFRNGITPSHACSAVPGSIMVVDQNEPLAGSTMASTDHPTPAFRAVCGPVHRAAALHSPARLVGAVRRDLDTTAPSTATARSNILGAMAYVLLHTGWRSRARHHHRRRPAARGRLNAVFLPSWTAGLPVCLVESSSELTLP